MFVVKNATVARVVCAGSIRKRGEKVAVLLRGGGFGAIILDDIRTAS